VPGRILQAAARPHRGDVRGRFSRTLIAARGVTRGQNSQASAVISRERNQLGQQRYGDRHCSDGQQAPVRCRSRRVARRVRSSSSMMNASICGHCPPVPGGDLRDVTKPSVRALSSHVGQRAVYCSPRLTVSRSAVSGIVGSAMVRKVPRACYLNSSRFMHGAVNDLGEADHETLPATSGSGSA